MTFYEKFVEECSKVGKAPSIALEEMGLNRSTLTGWKKGKAIPSDISMALAARYFGCDLEEFAVARAESIAFCSEEKKRRRGPSALDGPKRVPLLTEITADKPLLATESIEDMIPAPPKVRADFALTCKGESMINARIFPGDIVYIKRQPIVENGEIAAVLIGEEATLKRVYIFKNRLTLMPENPLFDTINLLGEEMNQATILGKAVAVVSFLNKRETGDGSLS